MIDILPVRKILTGQVSTKVWAVPGCRPLRGVATYENVYKLTYVRGPSGIIVMLAQDMTKN